jgi:hypothetical protein
MKTLATASLVIALALAPSLAGAASPEPGYPGEKEFNACKKLPDGKSTVKLKLKPESDVMDLIHWISAITCTPFIVPSTVPLQGRKVTILAPETMTVSEAYHLFYAALDAVNLNVEASGHVLRIVDTTRKR